MAVVWASIILLNGGRSQGVVLGHVCVVHFLGACSENRDVEGFLGHEKSLLKIEPCQCLHTW